MTTITIPKIEYQRLKKQAKAYEQVISIVQKDFFVPTILEMEEESIEDYKNPKALAKSIKRAMEDLRHGRVVKAL